MKICQLDFKFYGFIIIVRFLSGSDYVTQFTPIPIIINNMMSADDLFNELRSGVDNNNEVDQKFLYWSIKAIRQWKKICKRENYPAYEWGHTLIKKYAEDIVNKVNEYHESTGFDLVSIGAGTGLKNYLLLEELLEHARQNRGKMRSF